MEQIAIFRWNRNGADATGPPVKRLRPDVILWLPNGVMAFKGEDKALESDLNLARNELLSKLGCFSSAFFGSVPYQICYAAGGTVLEFVVIARDLTGGRPTLSGLTERVDLATVNGRSRCVRYAINIAMVLVSLQNAYLEGSVLQLGSKIKTDSSVVQILGDFVRKKSSIYTDYRLRALYDLIGTSRAPSLVSANKVADNRKGEMTVDTAPVGLCGKKPVTLAEVKHAGCAILVALQWLHRNGWVHRDIRVSNIMFADDRWYLMDLEWANNADLEIGTYEPLQEYTPPELVGVDGGKWTSACDMWQFAQLIKSWGHLDAEGRQFVATQSLVSPATRLPTEECLQHAFFKEQVPS